MMNRERKQEYDKEYRKKNLDKCREASRRNSEKRITIFKDILHNLKINGCALCGYNKYDGALDFHHVNPEDKKFSISQRGWSRSNDVIAEELNKCILFCSNCHREIEDAGRRH